MDSPKIAPKINKHELINTPIEIELLPEQKKVEEDDSTVIFFSGCGGTLDESSAAVADLMDKVAKKDGQPDFCYLLGDNYYKNFTSYEDPQLHLTYESYKPDSKFIAVLGNHDDPEHVLLTYLDEQGKFSEEKIKLLRSGKIKIADLPHVTIGRNLNVLYKRDNTFGIDSSRFVEDFLNYKDHQHKTFNQVSWLKEKYNKSDSRYKILILHHPPRTIDKRVFWADTENYLTKDQIAKLSMQGNYNDFILQILENEGLIFDLVLCAHTHALSCISNDNLFQVIAGGGGGELQSRMDFTPKDVALYLPAHGFWRLTLQSTYFYVDAFTTPENFVRIDWKGQIVRSEEPEPKAVQCLRFTALAACELFLEMNKNPTKSDRMHEFLKRLTWGAWFNLTGKFALNVVQQIMYFFKIYRPLTLQESLEFLDTALKQNNALAIYLEFNPQENNYQITPKFFEHRNNLQSYAENPSRFWSRQESKIEHEAKSQAEFSSSRRPSQP